MSIYLSASSITDFIKCPQKVLYRRTKPSWEVKSKEMIMGIVSHASISVGWNSKEKAYEVINYWVKKEGLSNKDKIDLQFYVDIFFLNFRHLLQEDDLIEHNFKIPIHDDIFIVGKMDRISKGNIFDWKTGKVSKNINNDVQCIIYEWAYEKINKTQASSICLASLSTGELVPYRKNEFYVKELFENIIPRMIKTVKNDTYERLGMFNHSCFRCPYKIGCLGGVEGESDYVVDSGISPE